MNFPKPGDKIRIILKSGQIKEGLCKFWSEKDNNIFWSCLKPNKNSDEELMIKQDYIMGFLIIKEHPEIMKKIVVEEDVNIENKILDDDLKLKKLAELRIMKSNLEKEQIKKHIHRTDVGGIREVQYVLPTFKKHS